MSYKVLDKNLLPVGDLILENNIGATNFWGDQVTRQLAQDDSNQDPATTMSMTVNSTDAKANNKLWNHTLSLSFDNTEDVGSKVVAQDSYLLYQDEQTGRWYLMNVYQSDEYENYRTAQAQNSAIIELSKIYTTGKTFTQARLTDIVNYVFSFVPFSAQIADDSGIILDSYTIDKATSVQAIIQDLQVKYDVDVDAFVEMDNNGRINNRVISFEHVGHNNGAKIWYGSAVKGAESIQRTGISSTLYTKFYINGVAKDGDADSGSIKSVNAGKDYIVDDTANEMYNPIGASMDVPTYLEVRLENTLLSEPTALLSWGNKIVGLFNHPRFNYVVTSMHDADYGLGDTVVVNDDSKKPALVISSRVIQIITSQASPETNTITLGEFSNLFTIKNEQATTILTLKKDINIVQIAADNAVNQAQLAHNQAVEAQSKAIVAQATADGKATAFTVNSIDDLPATANQGDIAWVTLSDGTHGYTYLNGKWVEDINPNLKKSIQDSVTTAVSQAKSHVDEVKQGLSSDIATAKSQAASLASTAEANAKSAATSQFNQAQNVLAEAKTNLQNDIDESKGNIVEINQKLTGFDGTLQRVQDAVNGLGQTNQLMNTEFTPDFQGWSADTGYELSSGLPTYEGSNVIHIKTTNTGYEYLRQSVPVAPGQVISFGTMMKFAPTSPDGDTIYWRYSLNFYKASGGSSLGIIYGKINYQVLDWTLQKSENIVVPADTAYMNVTYYLRGAGEAWLSKPMLVFESTIGTYIQGNYNNNDALAKVKLTADQARLDLSTYITDADGRIKKAQSGIEVNATAITKKVSQTDYDNKTGELSTKLNTTTDTADGTKQELSDYKEYANGNISGVASDLRKVAGEVDLKLTKTDYDDSQSKLNTSLSQWKADYDGWTGTVSKLSDKVNDLGQTNQLMNTEFNPDLEGWIISETSSGSSTPYRSYFQNNINATVVGFNTTSASASTYARFQQKVQLPSTPTSGKAVSMSWYSNTGQTDNYNNLWVRFYDNADTKLLESNKSWADLKGNNPSGNNSWTAQNKWENITVPDTATYLIVSFEAREGTTAYLGHPMLVFGPTIGAYSAGTYNNNAALAQVKVTADGISNFVRDSSGNISSNFQTALSKTSIITDSTLATSIQKQTETQISSALTDNNGKIISLINQDSSGVQIAGENIILDGKVRITNEFTVGQANIANGAIGNAQIGDASISSAKIANLDASKISGGTISGVDFNVNRRMTIASGGIIHSDVMDITKDAFNLLGMMNNTKTFVTAYNTQVSFSNAVYGIDSSSGEIHSSGKINTIHAQGDFTSSYSNDHLMFSTVNWTDGSEDNFVHITDANITILSGADLADTATDYSNISPVRIRTTGDMIAGSSITSGNIQLNSYHSIISQDGLPLYVTGNGGNPVDFNVNQLTANNIVLNAAHSIISKDNGKMYFYGGNGNQVDLGVKSLTQSSLVSLKENIAEVDEFDLLHKTISADLNRYNFIGDNDKYTHVTPMIDDVNGKKYIPKEWVSEDGRSVDTYTIIGYLVGSVKALQKQINKLEQG